MTDSRRKPPSFYEENPQARLSFTRFSCFKRCPAWFRHIYLEWHRTWTIPVLRAGHAVQEALERTFDAKPAPEVDFDGLRDRALARMKTIFADAWERARREHEADPNAVGEWDLPVARYERYLENGLSFHLQEVRARLDARHPRTGAPLPLPAAGGVAAAWAAVRPAHAPHGGGPAAGMEAIPAGFFQGQFDLVYAWTGGRRIVDVKASGGSSPFGTEIGLQLLSYAYLDRALGRGRPEGLEAWFLGRSEPTTFPVPDDAALDAFEAELHELLDRSGAERGFGEWRAEDFPPAPQELPGYPAAGGEPSAWCGLCPGQFTCPRTARRIPSPDGVVDFARPPEAGPAAVGGLVLGIGEPNDKGRKVTRRFTLANATGARSFTWEAATVARLIERGLKAGRVVRIEAVRPWKHPGSGDVLFYDSPATAVTVLADSPAPPAAADLPD